MAMSEKGVIAYLTRLEQQWPGHLWLFAADGRLLLMRKDENGQHAVTGMGGVNPDYIIQDFQIETDGGNRES